MFKFDSWYVTHFTSCLKKFTTCQTTKPRFLGLEGTLCNYSYRLAILIFTPTCSPSRLSQDPTMPSQSLLSDPQVLNLISKAISEATQDAIAPLVMRQTQFETDTVAKLNTLAIDITDIVNSVRVKVLCAK